MKSLILLLFTPVTMCGQALIGSYPFTGNADADGAGNNGVVNGAVLTSDRFGISNAAYLFDGIDDYIDLGQGYSYSSHTFSAWYNCSVYPSGASFKAEIVSKLNNDDCPYQNSEIAIRDDKVIEMAMGTVGTWEGLTTTDTAILNRWTHIVFSYNATTNKVKLYWDGLLTDSLTVLGYSNATTADIYVGARPGLAGIIDFYFNGAIDDIHIYDYEISSAMVDSLYNYNPLTTGITEIDNGPMVVYPNPGEGVFYISGSADIFDIHGRFLFNSIGVIDLTGYSDGLYYYKSGNKAGKIIKVVAEK